MDWGGHNKAQLKAMRNINTLSAANRPNRYMAIKKKKKPTT